MSGVQLSVQAATHGSSWGVSLVRLPTVSLHEVSFCKYDIPQAVPAKGCLVNLGSRYVFGGGLSFDSRTGDKCLRSIC